MSVRPPARLRFLLGCAALPVAAALGAAVAISIPAARAALIPTLPTVTLPLPTVPDLPIVTTTTATTAPTGTGTNPATTTNDGRGGGVTTTSAGLPAVANAEVAGAIRLPSGVFSIPISSVTAPARLRIDRLTISPKWIGVHGQRVRIAVRVTDSRGYRVRGASVDVRSTPARMLTRTAAGTTSKDGTASLQLSTTPLAPLRAGTKLILVLRAYQVGADSSSTIARRVVSLPIRSR